jgi:uncharacterized protein YndB with AHSA1/START domain
MTNVENKLVNGFEIVSSRIFPVARDVLFEAFINPEHLQHWWGPKGFTTTIEEFDPRPSGLWIFTMHGPDGTKYPTTKEFIEIDRPARIVLRHRQTGHDFLMTMTFDDLGEKSRLTWLMQFEQDADNPSLPGFIADANDQNFDRLTAFLNKPQERKAK